jgi:hypothetical protein
VQAPGRVTLTSQLGGRVDPNAIALQLLAKLGATPVQRRTGDGSGETTRHDPHAIAARGLSGGGGALPHLAVVQRAFGQHDVSGVRAHVGGAAADASRDLGAHAYASGDQVAFAEAPDLFLVAHEAAHVVQQRGGVQLAGGLGAAGDVYEHHADEVAAAVVRGESAEALLDRHAGPGGGGGVQRRTQVAAAAVQFQERDRSGGGSPAGNAAQGEGSGGGTDAAPQDAQGEGRSGVGSLNASWFSVSGTRPRLRDQGRVTYADSPDNSREFQIQASPVSYNGRLSVTREGQTQGRGTTVAYGTIQTVTSSQRTGVYRDDRNNIVAERRTPVRSTRDAFPFGPPNGQPEYDPPPWYTRSGQLALGETPRPKDVFFHDRPGFTLPKEHGGGRLKNVWGSDNFETWVAVMPEGSSRPTRIGEAYTWSVPWTVNIAPGGSGEGARMSVGTTDTPGDAQHGAPANEASQAEQHSVYRSVEAASRVPTRELLREVAAARRHAGQSFQHILTVLEQRAVSLAFRVELGGERDEAQPGALHLYAGSRRIAERSYEDIRRGAGYNLSIGMAGLLRGLHGGTSVTLTAYRRGGPTWRFDGGFALPFDSLPTRQARDDGNATLTARLENADVPPRR